MGIGKVSKKVKRLSEVRKGLKAHKVEGSGRKRNKKRVKKRRK